MTLAMVNSLVCMVGSLVSSPKKVRKDTEKDVAVEQETIPSKEAQQNRDPVHCEPITKDMIPSNTDANFSDTESDTSSLSPPQSPTPSLDAGSSSGSEEDLPQHLPRVRRGERVLLNPLAIKFSQDRCRPNFQDGREVNDASALVTPVPFAEAFSTPDAEERFESLENPEEYDELLAHPFPTVEVIRWRAKARGVDGNWVKDPATGKDKMGEEQWFTLDNRRLYALQQAAVRAWPKRCCVVVRVLRGDFGHALKKFKTSSNGRTVEVGNRFWEKNETKNTNLTWSWEAAVECLEEAPSAAEEEVAQKAITKDERRGSECACVRAGGCARLLELPKYKGEEAPPLVVPELKLPASKATTTEAKKKDGSRRFEYWLASKEGTRPPAPKKAPPAQAPAPAPAPGNAGAMSMADRVAEIARAKKNASTQQASQKHTTALLQLMKKKTEEEICSDASTRASSGDEGSLRGAAPAPAAQKVKRRQRGRQQGAAAPQQWTAKA